MSSFVWNRIENILVGTHYKFEYRPKIAFFDMDSTLILVKSGKKFAQNSDDWKLFSGNVTNKLNTLYADQYCIVIISNQKGLKTIDDQSTWKEKIEKIHNSIQIPIKVFASLADDIYRKPNIGLFNIIKESVDNISISASFYCGDAAGRQGDHSDCDLKFALNCNLNFYLPEHLFDGENNNVPKVQYPIDLYSIGNNTNNNEVIELNFENNTEPFKSKNRELVIMLGYPGSGKSSYVRNNMSGYIVVNMDTLKSKKKCLSVCEFGMKNGQSVVIDNTNPDKKTRKEYIDLALKYKFSVRCIHIITNEGLSKHNAQYRAINSNNTIKTVPELVYRIHNKRYEPIDMKGEKINEYIKVNPVLINDPNYMMYYY